MINQRPGELSDDTLRAADWITAGDLVVFGQNELPHGGTVHVVHADLSHEDAESRLAFVRRVERLKGLSRL